MKSLTLGAFALVLTLASGTAFAFHCPVDMKKIDAAMAKGPALDAGQMAAVKELRATGETLHKNGKHYAAVAVLAEARKILGIQ